MKNMIFLFATILLLSSCSNSATEQIPTADSCVVDITVADTVKADTVVVVADTVK